LDVTECEMILVKSRKLCDIAARKGEGERGR
jgi:hypothetical protein